MKSAILLLALATTAAACSEPAAEGSSLASDLTAGSCTPPPTLLRLTKSNAAHYEVFASDDEARAAVTPMLEASGFTLATAEAPASAKEIVATQFAAFQKLYPEHTAGMTAPPRVFLIDSPAVGAFATTDPSKDQVYPWVFFINTGFLEADEVKNVPGVLATTIAHELGHLILKNIFARDQYRFYSVPGADGDRFGFAQASDPVIANAYATYQATATRMGRFFDPALGNVPFHIGSQPEPTYSGYIDLMGQAVAASGAAMPAACAELTDAQTRLQAIVDRRLDKSDLTLPLGDDTAQAAALSMAWENALRSCLGGLTGSLGDLVAEGRTELAAAGRTPAEIDALLPALDATDAALDRATESPATVDHLLALASSRRAAMAKVVGDGYASLRFFSEEEEADDVSVRIALLTGSPVDMILDPYSPSYRDDCLAKLAAGERPEYGGFVDAHHGLCWRYEHVTTLARTLASCR